jgi:hypothetical protein
MSSHKNHEKLSQIKDAVVKSQELSENEKTNTLKHIDECCWRIKLRGSF